MKRRTFLKSAVSVIGVAGLAGGAVRSCTRSPNEDVRLAFVGLQRRGPQLIRLFREVPGVRVTALCDCDTEFLDRETRKLHDEGVVVRKYVDYRRLIEDKDIDAVVLATPDHWHALMTVWACQAGKEIYVEKPVSHNLWEGRRMVEAARKYNRVVQAGTQERSDVGLIAAAEYMASGALGKIELARAFCRPMKRSIGRADGTQKIPVSCNYDLFQGPAPLVPLRRRKLHYDWHFFWDTGTGDTGNRGVHVLDDTWWMTGCTQLPRNVMSLSGRFGWNDDGETPNTHLAYFDTKPVPMLLQILSLPIDKPLRLRKAFRHVPANLGFECEGGYVAARRGGATAYDLDGQIMREFPGDGGNGHYANFIEAVRSRNVKDLKAEIGAGHLTTALCHLANISHLTGRRASPDEIAAEKGTPDVLVTETNRLLEHLQFNQVDITANRVTLGTALTFDPQTERFTGDHSQAANAILSRRYRPPYTMPQVL